MEKSEQEQFLSDLDIKKEDDVFEKPIVETETPEIKEGEEVETEDKPQLVNRKIRRDLARGQRYREEALVLGERLKTLSEVSKFREEAGDDHLKEVEAIFGTDTPEKLAATNILKKSLEGMSERAVQKALEQVESRQSSETQAVREEEDNIDNMLERVEDETDLDLSEGGKDRNGYLTLLEKLSPKDRDGNIIEYADPEATAELYLSRREKSNDRAKELANRSMTRSGASEAPSKLEEDANWRWLKENGIF